MIDIKQKNYISSNRWIVHKRPLSSRIAILIAILWVYAFSALNGFAQSDALGPQIQISANIYEYRLDTQKQLGLFYQYNRTTGSVQTSDVFLHGTDSIKENPIPAVDLSGSFATLTYGSIDYNLKTAIEEGRATIISNPNLITRNGVSSRILSGEKVPLSVVTEKGTVTTLTSEELETGIKLNVTPHIFREDNILMDLELESGEITRMEVFDRGDGQRYELPVYTKRNIKTVVIVPSGKQLLVGGLFTETSSNTTRKVPIAGDLPGFGYFLRGFNKQKGRTETIFQITPTIKPPGAGLDYEAPVFKDLLEPKENEETIINTPRVINEAPIQELNNNNIESGQLPGSVQSQIQSATEPILIPDATASITIPAQSGIEAATTTPVEEPRNNRRRNSKGRPIR